MGNVRYTIFCFILPLLLCRLSADEGGWKKLEIREGESLWASSVLTETLGGLKVSYGPEALFDGDISTPWVEGAEGTGVGENVLIQTRKIVSALDITNGFASSSRLFTRNNRLRAVSLSLVAGLTAPGLVTELDYILYFVREKEISGDFFLKDSPSPRRIDISSTSGEQVSFFDEVVTAFAREYPDFYSMILQDLGISPEEGDALMYRKLILEMYGFYGLRLTINEVYAGTHYNDTCIAELKLELEEF